MLFNCCHHLFSPFLFFDTGAISHLITYYEFPQKEWYIVGDDDTMFNPLALAQWLRNFNSSQLWYIGNRSDKLSSRQHWGWDMAFGGGGIVLSGGFMDSSHETLEECFHELPWKSLFGGDQALGLCLRRLGVPLTPGTGFHQLDTASHFFLTDLLERHPVAPFLSIHHGSKLFSANHLEKSLFFNRMYRDPTGFLQHTVAEFKSNFNADTKWAIEIASGHCVKLHKRYSIHRDKVVYQRARSEAFAEAPFGTPFHNNNDHSSSLRYIPLTAENTTGIDDSLTIIMYDSNATEKPYDLIIVTEERIAGRWIGSPSEPRVNFARETLLRSRKKNSASSLLLQVGLTDCRVPKNKPARILTNEGLKSLLSKFAPNIPVDGVTVMHRDLDRWGEHLKTIETPDHISVLKLLARKRAQVSLHAANYPGSAMGFPDSSDANISNAVVLTNLHQAYFYIRPALDGKEDHVSFELATQPDVFLTHEGEAVLMMPRDESDELSRTHRSSFKVRASLNGKHYAFSLESVGIPNSFLRQQKTQVLVHPFTQSDHEFRADASWIAETGF